MPQASPMKWMAMSIILVASQLINMSVISQSKNCSSPSFSIKQKYMKWMW